MRKILLVSFIILTLCITPCLAMGQWSEEVLILKQQLAQKTINLVNAQYQILQIQAQGLETQATQAKKELDEYTELLKAFQPEPIPEQLDEPTGEQQPPNNE